MDYLIGLIVIVALIQLYRMKKNPQLKEKYKQQNKDDFDSIKASFTSTIQPTQNTYVDNMQITLSLKSDKNKMLYKILQDKKIKCDVLYCHYDDYDKEDKSVVGIFKNDDDRVIGFYASDGSNNKDYEIMSVFDVKTKDGKFRALDETYYLDKFINNETITFKSFFNQKTYERSLIDNIKIKATN